MLIKLSREQEMNIERAYHSLKENELRSKKTAILNSYTGVLEPMVDLLGIRNKLDEIEIDLIPTAGNCFFIDADKKRIKIFFSDVDNDRDFAYAARHQLGHAQDVLIRNFDIEKFNKIASRNAGGAYFMWDIYLDGRLAREKYFSYFQSKSLYYEYKMKLRGLAKKESDLIDEFFDSAWMKHEYEAQDIIASYKIFFDETP